MPGRRSRRPGLSPETSAAGANFGRMHAVNFHEAQFTYEGTEPEGFASGEAYDLREAGGRALNVRLYEARPGQALCPYHYEYEEEWLLVTDGAPTLRDPDGEHPLKAGDLVCFTPGPDGAHQVINRTDQPVRALMWSSAREPVIAVYPDSDKIGLFAPGKEDSGMVRRRDTSIDYWDGESGPR
jgi:uncharacterized cupin superfamily protein